MQYNEQFFSALPQAHSIFAVNPWDAMVALGRKKLNSSGIDYNAMSNPRPINIPSNASRFSSMSGWGNNPTNNTSTPKQGK